MSKKIRVAINGFGRIGRPSFRIALGKEDLEIVAINDLTDTKTLAHLLAYDSLYGRYGRKVEADQNNIIIEGVKFPVYAEKEPDKLPWKDFEVDIVLECTGRFRTRETANLHLIAGAKKVIISAPPKDQNISQYILGVNEDNIDPQEKIISNGSCTTNCLAPVVKVLNDEFKIESGLMTTIHSYTNDQKILDLPHRDLRRARAAAVNMIPTTTGAVKSVIEVISSLAGKLDGIAVRVPTPVVSLVDFVAQVRKETNAEEVNKIFKYQAENKLKGILGITGEPLVSSDFRGDPRSAIVDLSLTQVRGNLVKVLAWYDNEWGYANRYVEMAQNLGKFVS